MKITADPFSNSPQELADDTHLRFHIGQHNHIDVFDRRGVLVIRGSRGLQLIPRVTNEIEITLEE